MAIFKCKMCGGTLEIENGKTVAVCEYCGTQQTLPKLDDDKRANMYDRANHFRRNNEYDKAVSIYEQILAEDKTDAEAYWSLVLCRYGIEYVEDPVSKKRVPTVNRAQYTSVMLDEDYKSALEYADVLQSAIYEEEAKAIDEIQKGILAISQKEEPFDVFICYKETDSNGRRTPDSVYAQDIYNALTKEGYKVFFSRITLEDKLGSAYEPYIFAALNSAKVMLVVGTKQEHFNAIWVKNEWSRYLALIKNGETKTLIPCYKDINAYDLPEEFSYLQSQDLSKLGAIQDIVHVVQKLIKPKEQNKVEIAADSMDSRFIEKMTASANKALMEEKWDAAERCAENINDYEQDNVMYYLVSLLVELKCKNVKLLPEMDKKPLDSYENFNKAVENADNMLKAELLEYNETVKQRIYNRADTLMKKKKYSGASFEFWLIREYKDAGEKWKVCRKKETSKTVKICTSIAVIIIVAVLAVMAVPYVKYAVAEHYLEKCEYNKAEKIFTSLAEDDFKDSKAMIFETKYQRALYQGKDYKLAVSAYNNLIEIWDYKDSSDKAKEIFENNKMNVLKNAQVGDYVWLGQYEQDGNFQNAKENIEWLVLDIQNDKALVISKYVLALEKFNPSSTNNRTQWSECNLRAWCNEYFWTNAFTDEERAMVSNSAILPDENPNSSTISKATNDNIFLLSITEAEEYFSSDEERIGIPTDYLKHLYGSCVEWWLRNSGNTYTFAAYVSDKGVINRKGNHVYQTGVGVRPAMWIDLSE